MQASENGSSSGRRSPRRIGVVPPGWTGEQKELGVLDVRKGRDHAAVALSVRAAGVR
jgi:hypothetical protein